MSRKINGIPFYAAVEVGGNLAYNSPTKGCYIRTNDKRIVRIGFNTYEHYILPLAEMRADFGIILPEPRSNESVGVYYRKVRSLGCIATFKAVKAYWEDLDTLWKIHNCIEFLAGA